jgi:hypothetical protein
MISAWMFCDLIVSMEQAEISPLEISGVVTPELAMAAAQPQ